MPESVKLFLLFMAVFAASGALTAFIVYFLVFPAINALLDTHLPVYGYTGEDSIPESISDIVPMTKRQRAREEERLKKEKAAQERAKKPRYNDLHKNVPTFILPPVDKHARAESLTISKINAAARSAEPELTEETDDEIKTVRPTRKKSTAAEADTVDISFIAPPPSDGDKTTSKGAKTTSDENKTTTNGTKTKA